MLQPDSSAAASSSAAAALAAAHHLIGRPVKQEQDQQETNTGAGVWEGVEISIGIC